MFYFVEDLRPKDPREVFTLATFVALAKPFAPTGGAPLPS
jgi:hypothetical protein